MTESENITKAERTRERILEAALRLFQEKDYGAATMREIAARADVAVGAAYYYFRSKDDIVMEFYKRLQARSAENCARVCRDTQDVEARVKAVLNDKFEQFAPSRHFLSVLFRSAGDPKHPLSPFSAETREIRDQAIGLFERCLADANVKVAEEFRPYLPRLFWLYQMGLILFWIHDATPGQTRTRLLMEKSLRLILQLMSLSRLPFLGGLRRSIAELLNSILAENATHAHADALPPQENRDPTAEEIAQALSDLADSPPEKKEP